MLVVGTPGSSGIAQQGLLYAVGFWELLSCTVIDGQRHPYMKLCYFEVIFL
ncbi:hypothetical protein FB556_0708 [Enteractinococcus coprophilus]|uniref:Uncharacterized protein n=1 Tax=Enteractinococcus coprophilus TaxID=1027633 RepID=A0A543ANV6_9MICC|nr:hypothetical protein FB556_0708 [Enteractinococcus coprophilus]